MELPRRHGGGGNDEAGYHGASKERSFIVFGDADLDLAVDAAMVFKFRCTGQTCVESERWQNFQTFKPSIDSPLVITVHQSFTGPREYSRAVHNQVSHTRRAASAGP
jgi:hypothetical protein